jgi:hypothetical protein
MVKYIDDPVFLANEETILYSMINKLIEVGGVYDKEVNVEKLIQ